MVDPLEAKRLAAKQMEKIKAKEKFKVSEIPFASTILFPMEHFWVTEKVGIVCIESFV